jgi:hypothetical protein
VAGELISVRTEVVLSAMVESIVAEALDRGGEPLAAAGVLDGVADTPALGALARLGWQARQIEVERFAPAREPWAEELLTPLELAREEPLERPAPDHPAAVSWRVPGPGGHVRHYVALRSIGASPVAVADARAAGLEDPTPLKRVWLYGFLVAATSER